MRFSPIACPLLLTAVLAACASPVRPAHDPDAPQPGDSAPAGYLGFRSGGLFRIYRLHVPGPGPSGPVPLVLALHGYSSNARDMEGAGFDAVADTAGFVVAYPEASQSPTTWNAGGPYEYWTGSTDDVRYISALIDTLAAHYPIDHGRVYAVGHSNGAFMVYRLAHELSARIAAVAPVAGSEFAIGYAQPEQPVAIVHVHALDDASVPFTGMVLGGVDVRAVPPVLEDWRRRQGGVAPPDTVVNAGGVLGLRWRTPSGRGDVALYTAANGGHRWPRTSVGGLEACDVIWSFFRSLPPRPR